MNFADRMRWVLLWETLLILSGLGLGAMLLVPALRIPITFFLLAIPSSTFILVFPHEPLIFAYAHQLNPALLGVLSGSGAAIAAAIDYQAFHQLLEARRLQPLKQIRIYRYAVRWFGVAPTWTTWLFFLLPLPDHVIRVLAPAAEMPRARYIAAVGLGRAPRGYALAVLGQNLNYPWWAPVLLGVLLVSLGVLPLLKRRRATPP